MSDHPIKRRVSRGCLTGYAETPIIEHVRDPDQDGQSSHGGRGEHGPVPCNLHLETMAKRALAFLGSRRRLQNLGVHRRRFFLKGGENLHADCAFPCVKACNMMHHIHRLLVSALVEQKLGRLLKAEHHETKKEDDQTQGTLGEEEISPALVAGFGAAGLARRYVRTGGERSSVRAISAREIRDEAIRDGRGDDHTERLKY